MKSLLCNRRAVLAFGAAAAASLVTKPSRAATPRRPVVVELFTSQGCSSCPKADAFLGDLAGHSDILALTLNVDYWDYIGWRDTLASPANTKRQYDYAARRGDNRVYTPQMIIDGYSHVVGSDRAAVMAIIEEQKSVVNGGTVPMSSSMTDKEIRIAVGAAPNDILRKECSVVLMTVQPKVTVAVEKGENAGRTITYYNVVRKMLPIGMWQGDAATLSLPRQGLAEGKEGVVCLLQIDATGHIIGALQWGLERGDT
jgi:hypothetical protein